MQGGFFNRVERVERVESDIDVGNAETVNHTPHPSFKADNPIVPDTPLPNLNISKHKIRRKGVKGFLGKLSLLILPIALIGCGVLTSCAVNITIGFIVFCILLIVVAIICLKFRRRILVKRTQRLLTDFSRGNWNSAMHSKNVYMRDPFVLYYLGVANLYIRQNYANAEKLFSESAECGVPEALIALGWMAENGWGKPKNMLLAQRLYREAETALPVAENSTPAGLSPKEKWSKGWSKVKSAVIALCTRWTNRK